MAIALLVVFGCEKAAKLCLNAEDTEVVSGDQPDADHLAAIRANQARLLHSLPGETGENRVLIAKGKICGIRERMRVVAVVGAEAATRDFWRKYVGLDGAVIGMSTFGASAPADALYKHFGITVEAVVEAAKSL